MSAEVEPNAPTAGSASAEGSEEPLAARLVERALDGAMAQMASAQSDLEAMSEDEKSAAEPLAQRLVDEAVEEAVGEVGRRLLAEEKEREMGDIEMLVRSDGNFPEEKKKTASVEEFAEIEKETTGVEEFAEIEKETKEEEKETKEEEKETEEEEKETEEEEKETEEEEKETKEEEKENEKEKEEEEEEKKEKEKEEEEDKKDEEKEEADPYMDILGNGLLRKKTLVPGKGRDTRPLHGDSVTVSYATFLAESGKEVGREEKTFVVGDGDVIQALDLAVALSELQEEFELIADARFAFGKKGLPPHIPPNANLRFEAHLQRCDEPPAFASMTSQQRLACANQKRERGNFLYEREEYALSINSYNKALEILAAGRRHSTTSSPSLPAGQAPAGEAEESSEEEVRETKIKIYNNMAAAQIRIDAFEAAVQSCDEVLKMSPENVKALFRRGKAKVGAGEFAEAVRCLRLALRLEPDSRIVQTELNRVMALVKRERESQQKLYRRMFGGNGPAEQEASGGAAGSTQSWRRYLWFGAGVALVGVSVGLASAAIKYHQQHP